MCEKEMHAMQMKKSLS